MDIRNHLDHKRIFKSILTILGACMVAQLFTHNFIPNEEYLSLSVYFVIAGTILLYIYAVLLGGFPASLFSEYALSTYNKTILHVLGIGLFSLGLYVSFTYVFPSIYTYFNGTKTINTFLVSKSNSSSYHSCNKKLKLEEYHLFFFHYCINNSMYEGFPNENARIAFDVKSTSFGYLVDRVSTHPLYR